MVNYISQPTAYPLASSYARHWNLRRRRRNTFQNWLPSLEACSRSTNAFNYSI